MQKILIVDDEAVLADGLVMLFQLEQIEAVTASTREAAEAMMREEFFPVILADVRLRSEEDGLQLLESIRELTPRSQVASLTGGVSASTELQLRALGARTVLYKPIDFDELLRIVRELLGADDTIADTGDDLDLDALYENVRKLLQALPGRRFGLSRDETEEIVQEAWCLFLEKRATIRQPRAWLAGAVVNLCKQFIGTQRKKRETESELSPELVATGSSGDLSVLAVHQALSRVDERTRKLCTLIGLENRSYDEVSSALGIPLGSIGPMYMRAKGRLRDAIVSS